MTTAGRPVLGLSVPILRTWRSFDIGSVRRLTLSIVLICATLTSATLLMSFSREGVESAAREGNGNALRQSIYILCVVATLIATRPLAYPTRIFPFPPRLYALLAFCIISLTWSATPFVGLRRLTLTFIVIWLMFRIVNELGHRRAMRIMVLALVGILIASFISIALVPAAIHQGGGGDPALGGNWRGIMPHKNDAGPIMAVTIILLSFGQGRIRLLLRLTLIVAAAYFLFRTQSKSSMGLVGIGLVAGAFHLRYSPAYRALLIPGLLIAIAGVIYASVTMVPPFLASLDSSQDAFTGRVQIWQTMIAFLHDNAWLGAGFGSFWDSGPVSPANVYGRSWVASAVAQGHNGYLDNWTQLGVFGLAITVSVFFIIPIAKSLLATNIPRRPAAAAVATIVFLFGINMTESSLLMRDFFGNLMLSFVVACIDDMVRNQHKHFLTGQHLPTSRVPRNV